MPQFATRFDVSLCMTEFALPDAETEEQHNEVR